ncbi:MAG: radical SAM family heme chaperone HemW [Persicimonas sp.]
MRRRDDAACGIYVHVPFCARQCPYCDFAVDVRKTIPHTEYADALIEEFSGRRHLIDGRDVRTIYFGGGTPSLWQPEQLDRVMREIRGALGPDEPAEVTLEANPDDVTRSNLSAWCDAGVTRLSIGCQSFQPRVLKSLNRNHTPERAIEAVELALAHGPDIVSLDLIFGNPGQSFEEWEADLDQVEQFVLESDGSERNDRLDHLSAYHLTIEPGTAFARRRAKGRLSVPDDDRSFEMLERLVARCEELGLMRYEVSNFARAGCRSQHNTLYWTGAEYLGLGVGAHSLQIDAEDGVVRRANPRLTADYLASPGEPGELEQLSAKEHLVERLFLGIRTREGLDFAQLRRQFGGAVPTEWLDRAEGGLDEMVDSAFLERSTHIYYPTHAGLNLADALAERFFAAFE